MFKKIQHNCLSKCFLSSKYRMISEGSCDNAENSAFAFYIWKYIQIEKESYILQWYFFILFIN